MNGRELALKALIGFENKGKTVPGLTVNAKKEKSREIGSTRIRCTADSQTRRRFATVGSLNRLT